MPNQEKISVIVEKLAAEFLAAGLSHEEIASIGWRLKIFIQAHQNAQRNQF
jgi:hypothetical protein